MAADSDGCAAICKLDWLDHKQLHLVTHISMLTDRQASFPNTGPAEPPRAVSGFAIYEFHESVPAVRT